MRLLLVVALLLMGNVALAQGESTLPDRVLYGEVVPAEIERLRPAGAGAFIVMETADYCLPCKVWKRDEEPSKKAAGWKVVMKAPTPGKVIPNFIVVIGDRCKRHDKYLTNADLREIVSALTGKKTSN